MSGSDLRIRRREAARRRCSPRVEYKPSRLTEVLYKAYQRKHGPLPLVFGKPSGLAKSEFIQAISTNRLDRKRWARYLDPQNGPLPRGWFGPFKAGPSALDIRDRGDVLTSSGRLWSLQAPALRRDCVLVKVKPLEGGPLRTREAITFLNTDGMTVEITGGGRVRISNQNRSSAIRGLFWRQPAMWVVDDHVDASDHAQSLLSGASWSGTRRFTLAHEKIDRIEIVSADGQRFNPNHSLADDIAVQMAALPRPLNPRLAKIETWSETRGFAEEGVENSKTWLTVEREPLTAIGLARAIELVEAMELRPALLARENAQAAFHVADSRRR